MSTLVARGVVAVFDPTRLRLARQAAMLRKKDLAQHVGVSAAAVSQYENGTTTPSPKVAAALALVLGMPIEFFSADPPLGEAPAATAHFRSLRATTQQERDRAFAHALLTWELAQVMRRFVQLPHFDLPGDLTLYPDDPARSAKQAAQEARRYLDLGTGPIPNVVRLLESRGVVCTRVPAQTRRVFAFSCSFPERPVVVLAAERTHLAAGRFDAAHELGHLLLHHDEEPGSHPVERQANAFASEFLAPSSELVEQLPSRADWSELLKLKRVWGISMQALLFRARELGIMSENIYRRAMTEVSARGWRRQEPGDEGLAEQPILLTRAAEAMAGLGMDIEDISAAARLSVETIDLIIATDRRPEIAVSA